MISLISGIGIDKFIETKSRVVGLGGGENGKLFFNGYRVSDGEDEKVLEMDGCTPMLYA